MESNLWAHSPTENSNGPNLLLDHLKQVARRSEKFASKFKSEKLGRIVGLLHDLGKADSEFQNYLQGKADSVDHKWPGTRVVSDFLQPLGFIIEGHHGGLKNLSDFKRYFQSIPDDFPEEVDHLKERLLDDVHLENPESLLPSYLENPDSEYVWEFFIRMLFSCLVDADFLDTEGHFYPNNAELRDQTYDISNLWAKLKTYEEKLIERSEQSDINDWREKIYRDCVKAGEEDQGFFSLTVPTGGGKTLSGMSFALKHAKTHDLDRVIVVVPYTTIIEQNADVYRDIFGHEAIVEHHSSIDSERDRPLNRLRSENWDAPIVITTTVQFFESLFSNKPSSCRKIHNIARSVVILDEVQTLPPRLLNPILDILKQLVQYYETSIVFSTATQPAFETRKGFDGVGHIREISRNPEEMYSSLNRNQYQLQIDEPLSTNEIAERFSDEDQGLMVLNTVDNAQEFYQIVSKRTSQENFHLSTRMCGAHRRKTMNEIRARLNQGKTCGLISTQCVEAGVDLDFQVVYREMGPLDSIVQAAGRCNRERRQEEGTVFLFSLEDESIPGGLYKTATDVTKTLFHREDWSWDDPHLFREYFSKLYDVTDLGGDLQKLRKNGKWKFQDISKQFRLINQPSIPVAVPWRKGKEILDSHDPRYLDRTFYRKIQPYIITINEWQWEEAQSYCAEYGDNLYRWAGDYDEKCGIVLEERGALIG